MPPKLGDFWLVTFEGEEYSAEVEELWISTETELTEEDIAYWHENGIEKVEDMPPEFSRHKDESFYKADGSLKDPTVSIPVKIVNYIGTTSYYTEISLEDFIMKVPPVIPKPKPDFAKLFEALGGGLKPKPKPSMSMGILLGAGIILFLVLK